LSFIAGSIVLLAVAATASAVSSVGRQRTLLDAGWRFYQEDSPTAPVPDWGAPVTNWAVTAASAGSTPQSIDAENPAAVWNPYSVGTDAFGGQPGYLFFRSTLAGGAAPLDVRFDSVDDNGWVWLNGQLLGANQGWDLAFSLPLSSAWSTKGPNVLDVLVQNNQGPGGLAGTVSLQYGPPPTPPCAEPSFDDSSWANVNLPHDYVVAGQFANYLDGGHGYLPVTTSWYRKSFTAPLSDQGQSVWIDFDGIYRDAWVWINGNFLGENKSGYSGFRYDVSKYLNYGGTNVIAVHVDPTWFEGWWYEGGGIYRHVWLNATAPVHVAPDGTFVTTNVDLGVPSAVVTIQTQLVNAGSTAVQCSLKSVVSRPNGQTLPAVATQVAIPANATITVTQSVAEPAAKLWSLDKPQMYGVASTVMRKGEIIDNYTTPFGIRTEYFDPNVGFFLNGKPVKIQGTCNHQDFSALGIGVPDSVLRWRIEQLKKMGCNAYRTSHNEVASELLDDCDQLGMLVMDEQRHLGDTYLSKTVPGTLCDNLSDFKQQLQRDRNHPSIVMWSICNEEYNMEGTEDGYQIAEAMKTVADEYDGTRPVTCAGWGGLAPVLDLFGLQYNDQEYAGIHSSDPGQPLLGSETSSEVGTRGEYAADPVDGYCSAYDIENPDVSWGDTAEDSWSSIAAYPFVAGGFVWTGFDYRGEPTPYGWPDVSSQFGIMDSIGLPKDNYYSYQAMWGMAPVVHILPHWNWAGSEGTLIDVWVFTNAPRVELFLNGKSLGAQSVAPDSHADWSVPYAAGTLTAKAYDGNGKVVAKEVVRTTGAPVALALSESLRTTPLSADGEDTAIVYADAIDSDGMVVPTASNEISFALTGAGQIAGTGNGDPASLEPNTGSRRALFNGYAAVFVKSIDGQPGPITLTASSPGLTSAAINLTSQ
jgi:beta-galactosidase